MREQRTRWSGGGSGGGSSTGEGRGGAGKCGGGVRGDRRGGDSDGSWQTQDATSTAFATFV